MARVRLISQRLQLLLNVVLLLMLTLVLLTLHKFSPSKPAQAQFANPHTIRPGGSLSLAGLTGTPTLIASLLATTEISSQPLLHSLDKPLNIRAGPSIEYPIIGTLK